MRSPDLKPQRGPIFKRRRGEGAYLEEHGGKGRGLLLGRMEGREGRRGRKRRERKFPSKSR